MSAVNPSLPPVPPTATQPTQDAAPAPRRRGMGSVGNIVRSLAVVLGLVLALILLVPRQNAVVQPPVDVVPLARQVAAQTKWQILYPQGLPSGWRATSVRFVRSTDGLMTWHAGYISPDDNYVAVEQTKSATALWVDAQVNRAKLEGSLHAAGRTWTKYDRKDKVQFSLVDRGGPGALTTVLTGTAPYSELVTFAGYLQPAAPAS